MVFLYYVRTNPLDNQDVFQKALAFVTEERRNKVLSFKHKEEQKRSLAAGVLEKLYRSGADANFNLSHSGNYAVCAVASQPIGVDIENVGMHIRTVEKEERLEKIMRRSFSKKEIQQVHQYMDFHARMQEATNIWTRKESYAKAYRKGLAMDFTRIDTSALKGYITVVLPDGYAISAYLIGEDKVNYKCEELDLVSLLK